MGQYDECRETVSVIVQSNSTTNHVIRGTTCIVYIQLPSSLFPASLPRLLGGRDVEISLHLCLPDSCRKDDVNELIKQVLRDVNFITTRAFCRDQEQPDFSKDTGAIFSLVIVCLLLACVVLGSLLDRYKRFSPLKGKNTYKHPELSAGTTVHKSAAGGLQNGSISKVKVDKKLTSKSGTLDTAFQNKIVSDETQEKIQRDKDHGSNHFIRSPPSETSPSSSASSPLSPPPQSPPPLSKSSPSPPPPSSPPLCVSDALWQKLFLSFSAFRNSETILSTRAARDSIGAIHGIRVISISWVILGHTLLLLYPASENPLTIADYLKSYHFQVIKNAGFSVDTFFLLSGVLTAYLFLKETSKTSRVTCKQMALYYFHRFCSASRSAGILATTCSFMFSRHWLSFH
ncbi:uncharacterized protein LOC121385683 isoform X2 [Gigantopelta aegis]|nr:uncharacterized protein LOC121385683 isoform X2 [Gigantopelta aegis]